MDEDKQIKLEAVILAGGQGSRLKPYTAEIPKPLVPVGDRPIIEILIKSLQKTGVTKLHFCVNHLAHLIVGLLGDGERYGMEIEYSHEDTPLSTVGPLKLIKSLPDNFLVVNGDILTDIDYQALYKNHLESEAMLTVATCRRQHSVDYGILKTDSDNAVIGFQEKPVLDYTVSMGVYVFTRQLLEFVPDNTKFGFDDLMLTLLERKAAVRSYPYDGYWLDIGRVEDYEQANRDISLIEKLFD